MSSLSLPNSRRLSMDRERKTIVFLAYSSEWPKSPDRAVKAIRECPDRWIQLEMFAFGCDSVVFLRPDVTDVLTTLRSLHIRHIVDLRDVPYLTFDKIDRSGFFHALAETCTDYMGMHELMHEQGV